MAFNTTNRRKVIPPRPGPMATSPIPTGVTGNGAPGYAYEDKSALFMLAVNSFFSQKKFYETAREGDDRFVNLVRKVTVADPAWMHSFLTWLRNGANIRSSAVVGSVEASLVMRKEDQKGSDLVGASQIGWARKLATSGLSRADEVGEAVAYFTSRYPGKQLPKALKRGLADQLCWSLDEYTAMKYGNSDSKEYTPDRLINLLHPSPKAPWQGDLFGYLVARKYGEVEIPTSLARLTLRKSILEMPVDVRKDFLRTNTGAAQVLKDAGMTWEALAGWLQGPMDAKAWEAIIPSMGYMALLRNLRNFDQAGICMDSVRYVQNKISDPEQVKRSKQFPFRFLAAYRSVPSLRWSAALSLAMDLSLKNIPKLPGRTLVLVDTSGSMNVAFSEHSEMKRWDAAALFGIALGFSSPQVDVVSYSGTSKQFPLTQGGDVLGHLQRWNSMGFNLGHGTDTFGALRANYRGHDRVIILTDEQVSPSPRNFPNSMPDDVHLFTFNLAGYRMGHAPTGRFRHAFGGLTDACFPLIDMIERAQEARWPWELEGSDGQA